MYVDCNVIEGIDSDPLGPKTEQASKSLEGSISRNIDLYGNIRYEMHPSPKYLLIWSRM